MLVNGRSWRARVARPARAAGGLLGLLLPLTLTLACGPGLQEPSAHALEISPEFLFLNIGDTATLEMATRRESMGSGALASFADPPDVIELDGLSLRAARDGITRIHVRHGEAADTATVVVGEIRATSVGTGTGFSCSLSAGGVVLCWGNNWYGQTGSGSTQRILDSPRPALIQEPVVHLTVGSSHACALTRAGALLCWGMGDYGELGDGVKGSLNRAFEPRPVASGIRFGAVAAGLYSTCALDGGGRLYCWGLNDGGVAGQPLHIEGVGEPRPVSSTLRFVDVDVGGSACGLTRAGAVYCWGPNELGQLGREGVPASAEPLEVASDMAFSAITVGDMHGCALAPDGAAYCWGRNWEGQLGFPDARAAFAPERVPLDVLLSSIEAGGRHTCGLTGAGEAYCWGSDWRGQLGRGTYATPPTLSGTSGFEPGLVQTEARFQQISPSTEEHTCGVVVDGRTFCWGWNITKETGTGIDEDVVTFPRPVLYPSG